MGDFENMAPNYVIDVYDRWNRWDRAHQRYLFSLNETEYAIFELDGTLPTYMDREFVVEEHKVYKSLEAARIFVHEVLSLARSAPA